MALRCRRVGVPLFVEEITRSVLASRSREERDGRHDLDDAVSFVIPATLQDSLVARLDRLGSAKDVALAASIIGREFPFDILAAVASLDHSALTAALEQLVRSDLVAQRGEPPNAAYSFKHALIRDAAYQTLLKSRKRDLHRHVAQTLESRFPELARNEPEVLAHHYTEAEIIDRALEFWRKAAERASASGPCRGDRPYPQGPGADIGIAGRSGPRRVGACVPHTHGARAHGLGGLGQPECPRHV